MKVLGKILVVLSVLIICGAIAMALLHIKPAVVISGSMEPTIHTGSLVLIDTKDKDVKKGDIVAFRKAGVFVTHRIVETRAEGYITKGDANSSDDPGMIGKENLEGTTILAVPYAGRVLKAVNLAWLRDITAYEFGSKGRINAFRVGGNQVSVIEDFLPPEKLKPGAQFRKKVTVKNTGLNPCKVRIMANFSDSSIADLAEVDFNTKDWEYKGDGYYYYRHELNHGDETECLFSSVKIKDDAPVEMLKDFEIIIYVESINEESGGFWK